MAKKPAEPVPQEEEEKIEEVPQVPQEGSGKFEYINGTQYEGEWKMFGNVKMKHGKGKIIHGNSTTDTYGNEIYEGDWQQDLMHGEGTYKFTNGAVYVGQWIKGKRHGNGRIDYPNGSSYEGEWANDEMHGDGRYVDAEGIIWDGIFVNNTYESKIQKKLQQERKVVLRKKLHEETAVSFFKKFFNAFQNSDKKTMKDNLAPWFARPEELSSYYKDPYPKYEDRTPDAWNDVFHKIIDGDEYNCSASSGPGDVKFIDPQRILIEQLTDAHGGQIVEFWNKVETKTYWVGLCELSNENWTIIHYQEKTN